MNRAKSTAGRPAVKHPKKRRVNDAFTCSPPAPEEPQDAPRFLTPKHEETYNRAPAEEPVQKQPPEPPRRVPRRVSRRAPRVPRYTRTQLQTHALQRLMQDYREVSSFIFQMGRHMGMPEHQIPQMRPWDPMEEAFLALDSLGAGESADELESSDEEENYYCQPL